MVRNFLKEELNLENSENIEFQRARRIGKKIVETRPVIVLLRFPELEMAFRRAREMEGETEIKVYSNLSKEISERIK